MDSLTSPLTSSPGPPLRDEVCGALGAGCTGTSPDAQSLLVYEAADTPLPDSPRFGAFLVCVNNAMSYYLTLPRGPISQNAVVFSLGCTREPPGKGETSLPPSLFLSLCTSVYLSPSPSPSGVMPDELRIADAAPNPLSVACMGDAHSHRGPGMALTFRHRVLHGHLCLFHSTGGCSLCFCRWGLCVSPSSSPQTPLVLARPRG